MESLTSIERDGERFFCFIEICAKLFPQLPKSTVRSWLKQLNIPCVTCTLSERVVFIESNACLSGSFGLISAKNVTKLLGYKYERKSKSPKSSKSSHTATPQCPASSCQISRSLFPVTSPSSSTPLSLVQYDSDSDSDSNSEACLGIPRETMTLTEQLIAPEVVIPKDTIIAAPEVVIPKETVLIAEEAVISPTSDIQPVKCGRRTSYKLPAEDITPVLKEEISALRKFYLSPINAQRDSAEFSLTTINKMIERILTFMFYAKEFKNKTDLCLNICNDEEIVSDFVIYLRKVRKLMPTTISSILTVLINVVKYNFRNDPVLSIQAPQLIAYRRLQRQFAKQGRFLAKTAKEGLTSKSSKKFYFALILETLRNLKAKHFESSRAIEKSRHLHDFVLISLYLRAMPGRSNDIRLLKLFVASETNSLELSEFSSLNNSLIFSDDNRVYLVQNDHKTAKSHGPSRLDLSDDEELVRYLRLYLECRPRLMHGKLHDSFFLNCNGEPFASSSAVSTYLGNLFEREVSMRVGTNKLRHAIVTYFQSLSESNDIGTRESLAALMKHSIRYQTQVYDDTTQDEKTKKGRDLLRKTVTAGLAEDSETVMEDDSAEESLSEGDVFEIRPKVNDICALLDPCSTAKNIDFFLAKVARFTPDESEAYLIHLDFVENSNNLYKVKPGKVWKESTSALVYPIDIVYNHSENAYQLRTSAEDIYQAVHNA